MSPFVRMFAQPQGIWIRACRMTALAYPLTAATMVGWAERRA